MTVELDRPHAPSVFDAGLPSIDYEHTQDPEEAHAIIRRAREQAPIALGAHGPEFLTYELVHTVLRDPRFSPPPGFILAAQGITSGPLWDRVVSSLLCMAGAEHHRLRRLVSKAFAPRAAARLRATISEVITELVTPLTATGSCDIVTDVAQKYPIPVICALLGTDRDDWKLFSDWTDDIMKTFSWTAAQDEPDILRSWAELDAYLDDMIAQRRTALTDDLISDLIRAEDDGDRLTHDEVLMLAAGLLMAGTDTTRNQVAAAVYTLCEHPDQWKLLADNPTSYRMRSKSSSATPRSPSRPSAPRPSTSNSQGSPSRRAPSSWSIPPAPTAIPPSTRIPIGSTSRASLRRRC